MVTACEIVESLKRMFGQPSAQLRHDALKYIFNSCSSSGTKTVRSSFGTKKCKKKNSGKGKAAANPGVVAPRDFLHNQIQGDTRKIVGTYGYMALEYVHKSHFLIKSDVFSFGVFVLEIVTGLKSDQVHPDNEIVGFAWRNWQNGNTLHITDSTLTRGSKKEMVRCIHIGLLCVQKNVAKRPTMVTILFILNSYSITLPRPSQPAFIFSSTNSQMSEQSNHNLTQELNNMSITDLYPC
ncbi:putative receptor-like protein kinase At4g00960 [Benincasa hispida]|uniref:putative receptor-like protein kinase At4g00960 n=1 Tax=Benincasa hispida TaxID=102211 RepID=UPI0018FF79F0|nr:putative receptor-like protein kinase At4g00960 [Benincasa hispida]